MQSNAGELRVALEIAIGGEDRRVAAQRNGTDQEIGRGALHSFAATDVIEPSCYFVIDCFERKIVERLQRNAQHFESLCVREAAEHFLSYWADQHGVLLAYECFPFIDSDLLTWRTLFTSLGERPDRSVDKHAHASVPPRLRRRSRL